MSHPTMTSPTATGLFSEPPLVAARRQDQAQRLERLHARIRRLHRLRVLLAVIILSAPLPALMELGEPVLLTNQGWTIPNPAVALPCLLLVLAFFRQRSARRQLLEAGQQLSEELKDGGLPALESRPASAGKLLALALIPSVILLACWEGWRLSCPERQLLAAARNGDLPTVRLALSRGARVNCRAADNHSPLEWAVRGENAELLQLLLSHGADPAYGRQDSALNRAVSGRMRWALRLMLPRLKTERSPQTGTEGVELRVLEEGNCLLEPRWFSRAELSIITGDVELMRKELGAFSSPTSRDRLLEAADRYHTEPQLREALRLPPVSTRGDERVDEGSVWR